MNFNDLLNGVFESVGSIFTWYNVYILYKDKQVKGFSKLVFAFFVLWGYWNLYYYPSLHQWLSFIGGISLVCANTVWIFLAIYYTYYRNNA